MGNNKMNHRNDITSLFENRLIEEIANSYSPNEVVKSLSFLDGLRLSYLLLYNDKWDENLQEFAIKLLYEIRKVYPEEWNASWEYDALLGGACNITCKYDERYEAYKRAFDKADNPPPGLLIEFARCCICPGSPPISYDQAIELILKALKQAHYADAIGLLSHIYSLKDDFQNEDYWSDILKNSNQEFVSPPIEPKFLVDEYLKDLNK
jgi:hypothetical protein